MTGPDVYEPTCYVDGAGVGGRGDGLADALGDWLDTLDWQRASLRANDLTPGGIRRRDELKRVLGAAGVP